MDVSLKYKVKNDYLYKTGRYPSGIQRTERKRCRQKKKSRNTRTCFGGSSVKELGL